MLLISHTGELGINSSYYPIFYLPVVTAAIYFDAMGNALLDLSRLRGLLLLPVSRLQDYDLAPGAIAELAIRILFFFLAAMVVNRFATENQTSDAALSDTGGATRQNKSRTGARPSRCSPF